MSNKIVWGGGRHQKTSFFDEKSEHNKTNNNRSTRTTRRERSIKGYRQRETDRETSIKKKIQTKNLPYPSVLQMTGFVLGNHNHRFSTFFVLKGTAVSLLLSLSLVSIFAHFLPVSVAFSCVVASQTRTGTSTSSIATTITETQRKDMSRAVTRSRVAAIAATAGTAGGGRHGTPTTVVVKKLVSFVQKELQNSSDKKKAQHMQKYLKTDMPMYGLQKPERAAVERKMYEEILSPAVAAADEKKISLDLYQTCVQTLWELPHREEKYLAIDMAMHYKEMIGMDSLFIYENMLREDFMWWDFVDPIAINLVGGTVKSNVEKMEPILRKWIMDEDNMWIRRSAILAQLKFKEMTNEELLFEFCRLRMHEKEFFIRKAIGWCLRQYSRTNPKAVKKFLLEEKPRLSALSYKEGSKRLVKAGLM